MENSGIVPDVSILPAVNKLTGVLPTTEISIFSKYIVSCLLDTTHWVLRDAALKKIILNLSLGQYDSSLPVVIRILREYSFVFLNDRNLALQNCGIRLVLEICQTLIRCNNLRENFNIFSGVVPILVDKISGKFSQTTRSSKECLLLFSNSDTALCFQVFNFLSRESASPLVCENRLKVCIEILQNLKINPQQVGLFGNLRSY